MLIKIVDAGFHSILVDAGRTGKQHLGLTASGPLDYSAYYWAAQLTGKSIGNSPCMIETVGQLVFKVNTSTCIAITGRAVRVWIDNQQHKPWQTLKVSAGQLIKVESELMGCRVYTAIEGGLGVQKVHGSASTVSREMLGGLRADGSAIKAGDEIPLSNPVTIPTRNKNAVTPYNYSLDSPIHIIPGYQYDMFDAVQKRLFFTSVYSVSAERNRMGIKLSGPAIRSPQQALFSEGLHLGAIQIPPNGQPIIMLSDRQTIGGYPKFGSIARIDLPRLAQAQPFERFSFVETDESSARNAWRLQHLRWNKGIM